MKLAVLLFLSLSVFVSAQEGVPPKHMRFIPLGEIPVWKEELTDKLRIQQEYEPGQMPPSEVMVGVRGVSSEPSRLHLREFTKLFTFSGVLEKLKIEQGTEENTSPWVDSPMPAAPYTLGVLFRDHEEMTWLKPRLQVFRDDLTVFPLGTMRFVNAGVLKMLVKINEEEPFMVKPGDAMVRPLPAGGARVQATAVVGEGLYRRIFDNNVVMKEGERIQSFFFKAQSPPPATQVKFLYRPEQFEAPKKPEKQEEDEGNKEQT